MFNVRNGTLSNLFYFDLLLVLAVLYNCFLIGVVSIAVCFRTIKLSVNDVIVSQKGSNGEGK